MAQTTVLNDRMDHMVMYGMDGWMDGWMNEWMDARDSRVVVAASSAGVTASWGVIGVALTVLSGWHVVGGGLSQVVRAKFGCLWRGHSLPVDFKIIQMYRSK